MVEVHWFLISLSSISVIADALLCYTDKTPVCDTSYKPTDQQPVKCDQQAIWCMTVVYKVGAKCYAVRQCGNSTNPNPAIGGDEDCARIAHNETQEVCEFCGNDYCNDGRLFQYPDGLYVNGSPEAKRHLDPVYISDIEKRRSISSSFSLFGACYVIIFSALIRYIS